MPSPMPGPPIFPLRPPPPPGRFRQVPPAVFPPILGLLALGLGWRRAVGDFGLPPGLAEMLLGAATLLWLFAALAYAAKLARRPGVLAEDVAILPGQAGCSALAMTMPLVALVLLPYAAGAAAALTLAGLALQTAVAALSLRAMLRQPPAARLVTPVWHLSFVGFIVAALPALDLGWAGLALLLFWACGGIALAIWGVSLGQALRRTPPAPLRPLLAIHLAPASLLGIVAAGTGQPGPALLLAVLGGALLAVLAASVRWITVAGFSPFWSAFTFPLAAYAGLLLTLPGPWRTAGGVMLIAASFVVLQILVRLMQSWAKGELARRTNAATA